MIPSVLLLWTLNDGSPRANGPITREVRRRGRSHDDVMRGVTALFHPDHYCCHC